VVVLPVVAVMLEALMQQPQAMLSPQSRWAAPITLWLFLCHLRPMRKKLEMLEGGEDDANVRN
jgi:hypothetical protein